VSCDGNSYAYDALVRPSHAVVWPVRLGSTGRIYACDGATTCIGLALRWFQEEGEGYEYASYHNDGGTESAKGHTEEALLYQPLGEGVNGTARDVKGGPGGGCAMKKNCKRQHEIWSKAGSGSGPSIEEEVRKFWHKLKCEIMAGGQLGAEETRIGHAMAEHGELEPRKC
jgi:hypothetical protein